MPNWCSNKLEISGDVEAFKTWLNGEPFTFSKIKPTPEEAMKKNAFDDGGWYNWRVENWGTKWDLEDVMINFDDEAFTHVETAWSPPLAAFETLSKLLPTVTFKLSYLEEGVGFCGCAFYQDGLISEEFYDSPDSEGWREFALREFDWQPYDEEEDVKNVERQKAQTA
jgi:hypothetical protein